MMPLLHKVVTPKQMRRTGGGGFADATHDDEVEQKVSHQLPPLPRLRIEGLGKGGAPIDLLPDINAKGRVVPDMWILPMTRKGRRWQENCAHTDFVRAKVEAHGLRMRILTDA